MYSTYSTYLAYELSLVAAVNQVEMEIKNRCYVV